MAMHDLDSQLLRAFVTVTELGTVSAAAARLNRTQSAISMQLKRLEDDLQQRLFDRSPRGLTLTSAGTTLLGYARQALGAGEAARRALSGANVTGAIRIGIIEDLAVSRLTDCLATFAVSHPSVQINLVVGCSSDLMAALGAGKLQLLVGDTSEQRRKPLVSWQHRLIWAGGPPIAPAHGIPLPLVLFDLDQPCSWREQALASLDRAGRAYRIAVSASSLAAMAACAQNGLGVTLMIEEAAVALGLAPASSELELPDLPKVVIGLYANRFTATDAAATALVSYLQENWSERRHLLRDDAYNLAAYADRRMHNETELDVLT